MFQVSLLKSSLSLPTIPRTKPKLFTLAQGRQWSGSCLYLCPPFLLGPSLRKPLWLPFSHSRPPYSCHPRALAHAGPSSRSTILGSWQWHGYHQLIIHCIPSFTFSGRTVLISQPGHPHPDSLSKHCKPPCPSTSCNWTLHILLQWCPQLSILCTSRTTFVLVPCGIPSDKCSACQRTGT